MSEFQSKPFVHSDSDQSLDTLRRISGPIRFRLTNAYMFVAVLQKNREALACLIAALLHIDRGEILSLDILNPIILGQSIKDKDCVLDILVLLNGNIKINLEMQVINEGNWTDRGVFYLARNLTDLKTGEDYANMKQVIQVGILDFDLWKDGRNPFFQQYRLWDLKNNRCFTDKVTLDVISLSQIEQASEEDRRSGLYQWARVFKADTWEELRMLAGKNKVIADTAATMASLSEDEKIRFQCLRQEKFERDRVNAISYATKTGIKQGLSQGIEQGLSLGIEQGKKQLLLEQIKKKLAKGQSAAQIADALEEDPETILQLIRGSEQTAASDS